MEKILTVVIPTYNIENYIAQCLESFALPEVMGEIEVLIVDDGSRDGSAAIAEEFVRRWPDTFRLIHKENGGHGSAINRGIREAAGRYFKVVDGDDWVDGAAFTALVKWLRRSESDAVVTNYFWYHHDTGKRELEIREPFPGVVYGKTYRFSEISRRFYMKMHGLTLRTEILKTRIPPIDEHCYYVDMEYVLFPVPWIETVTFLDEIVYLYRIGLPGQSMSIQSMCRNAENYDRVLKRLLKFYETECGRPSSSEAVQAYLANALGDMTASRFKIFLSFPFSRQVKRQMAEFDRNLKERYPAVYGAVRNRAVLALRRSGYLLYPPARLTFWAKERLKR